MGIKYSTGKGTKLRHSTALEWDDLEKAKKKYTPVKHATGEDASIKHATGTEFDYKVLSKTLESDSGPGLHSKPETDSAGGYLECYYQYLAEKRATELDDKRGKGRTKQK